MLLQRPDYRGVACLGFRQLLHDDVLFGRSSLRQLPEESTLDPHNKRIDDIRYDHAADYGGCDRPYPGKSL